MGDLVLEPGLSGRPTAISSDLAGLYELLRSENAIEMYTDTHTYRHANKHIQT